MGLLHTYRYFEDAYHITKRAEAYKRNKKKKKKNA